MSSKNMSSTRGRGVVRVTFGNTLVAPRQRERARLYCGGAGDDESGENNVELGRVRVWRYRKRAGTGMASWRARALWRFHRRSGLFVSSLLLPTVLSALLSARSRSTVRAADLHRTGRSAAGARAIAVELVVLLR